MPQAIDKGIEVMKSKMLLAAVAAVFVALPAAAQDTSVYMNTQGTDQHLAKDTLIGASIYGKDGKIIGDIEDLILTDGNTVIGVIIGTGGFLGLAEKRVGINLTALTSEEKDGATIITLPLSHEDLVKAEPYKRALPKKSLLERAKEKAKELADKTSETTKDAYEDAKPKIEEAKEKAKEAYEDAKKAVTGESEPAATDTPDDSAASTETPEAATETPAPAEPETPAASEPETPAATETAPSTETPAETETPATP